MLLQRMLLMASLFLLAINLSGCNDLEKPSFINNIANTAPTDILLSVYSVSESAPSDSVVASLSVIDSDLEDTFIFRIDDDPSNIFSIEGKELKLKNDIKLNYELVNKYSLLLTAIDSSGNEFQKAINIQVVDINEPPIDITISGGSISENAPAGTVAATLFTLDEDVGDRFKYYLLSGGSGNFELVNNEIRIAPIAYLNSNKITSHTLRIATEDLANNYFETNITINVEPAYIQTEEDWYKPGPNTTWQWQLQGDININYPVNLYDVDLFDTSVVLINQLKTSGKKIICYFSGGSFEDWRSDADQFTGADYGNSLDGWPGEYWLDIRKNNVQRIMLSRLDLAKQKGCDGVEPDNMDGYSNDNGLGLTASDQYNYNRMVAHEAHLRSLSIGLKNDLDQAADLMPYFDFAINESCHQYNECELLSSFVAAGKPVFNVEYARKYVTNTADRERLCNDSAARGLHTLILPDNLDDSFRFSCD